MSQNISTSADVQGARYLSLTSESHVPPKNNHSSLVPIQQLVKNIFANKKKTLNLNNFN